MAPIRALPLCVQKMSCRDAARHRLNCALFHGQAQRYARENALLQEIPEDEEEEGEADETIDFHKDIQESERLLRSNSPSGARSHGARSASPLRKLRHRPTLHDDLLSAPPDSRLKRLFIVLYCTLQPKHAIRFVYRTFAQLIPFP